MGRSIKKGPYIDHNLAAKVAGTDDKRAPIKTWARRSTIPPDFTLEDLAGNEVRLSDLRGKVVLVNFWATWCGPCRMEMPILQRFERTHADKGVIVLAVSTDRFNDRSQIKPFLEENNFDFKVLLEDPEQLTGYDYQGIPALLDDSISFDWLPSNLDRL